MDIIPAKNPKGIWTIVIIILVLVSIMFLNTYMGTGRQPLFSFLKKTPTPPAATTV